MESVSWREIREVRGAPSPHLVPARGCRHRACEHACYVAIPIDTFLLYLCVHRLIEVLMYHRVMTNKRDQIDLICVSESARTVRWCAFDEGSSTSAMHGMLMHDLAARLHSKSKALMRASAYPRFATAAS